jgi:hypothetical protein
VVKHKHKQLHEFAPMLGPCEEHAVGSLAWAELISYRLQLLTQHVGVNTVNELLNTIRSIWRANPKPWEIWPEGNPYRTPNDYCEAITAHTWDGLIGAVKEFAGDDFEVTEFEMRADLAKAQVEHRKPGAHHANNMMKQGSTNRDYLLRRLARDHEDILARYERGEFKSVRAAAIAAGIIKKPTPFEQVRKLLSKMDDSGRRRVFRYLEAEFAKGDLDQSSGATVTQLSMFQDRRAS